jgi:hypothetical protein
MAVILLLEPHSFTVYHLWNYEAYSVTDFNKTVILPFVLLYYTLNEKKWELLSVRLFFYLTVILVGKKKFKQTSLPKDSKIIRPV